MHIVSRSTGRGYRERPTDNLGTPVIDLHCHILPGLDDGAPDLEISLEMAEVALDEGIHTIAATPHVNLTYDVDADAMAQAVGKLNLALARNRMSLAVLPGGEVAVEKLANLDDAALRRYCLGGGTSVLVETPYTGTVPFLEDILFNLQLRGFRPVLAHPERSLAFRERPDRLAPLVERGIVTCINAASMAGRFGRGAQDLSLRFLERGLVHAVASDAHDPEHRPPRLLAPFLDAEERLPGIAAQARFFTADAPAALIAGKPLPERPEPPEPRPSAWRRLVRPARRQRER
jgi:protein-tyrosine phosphatase